MSKPTVNPFVPKKENKDEVIHFRVSAGQKAAWLKSLRELGVKDQSAFFRGAIEAAVAMSYRAQDPTWRDFITAIQSEAKSRLGAGITQEGASGYESGGKEAKTVSLESLKKKLNL